MASLQAKLLNRYIRMTVKSIPLHEYEPVQIREAFEKKKFPNFVKDIDIEDVSAPVVGEWHCPAKQKPDNVILYLHGGGYVFGSVRTHKGISHALAARCNANVFSLTYRLAPEHPCPAAIEDAVAAYKWLLALGHAPKNISISGDSAGGGLTIATLQALKQLNEPMPSCAVVFSPYLDLAFEGESYNANAEADVMFQQESFVEGSKHYVQDLDRKDPRCSPLYGDMTGLPPLLVFASSSEMLFDDSTRMVKKAEQANVDVSFVPRDDQVHVWPVMYPLTRESKEDVEHSATFIRKHSVEQSALGA